MQTIPWKDAFWSKPRDIIRETFVEYMYIEGTLESTTQYKGPISQEDEQTIESIEKLLNQTWSDILIIDGNQSKQKNKLFYKAAIDVRLDYFGWGMQFTGESYSREAGTQISYNALLPLDNQKGNTRKILESLISHTSFFDKIELRKSLHMSARILEDLGRALALGDKGKRYLPRLPKRAVHLDQVEARQGILIDEAKQFLKERNLL